MARVGHNDPKTTLSICTHITNNITKSAIFIKCWSIILQKTMILIYQANTLHADEPPAIFYDK